MISKNTKEDHLIRVLQLAALADVPVGGNVCGLLASEDELQSRLLEPSSSLRAKNRRRNQDTMHRVEGQGLEPHSSGKLESAWLLRSDH